jgi:hypothetical protein
MSTLEAPRQPRLEKPRVQVLSPEEQRRKELQSHLEMAQFYMRKWNMSPARAVEAVLTETGIAKYPPHTREAWRREITSML